MKESEIDINTCYMQPSDMEFVDELLESAAVDSIELAFNLRVTKKNDYKITRAISGPDYKKIDSLRRFEERSFLIVQKLMIEVKRLRILLAEKESQ